MKRAFFLILIYLSLQCFFLVPVSLSNMYFPKLANSSVMVSFSAFLPHIVMVGLLHKAGYFKIEKSLFLPKRSSIGIVVFSFLAFLVLVPGIGMFTKMIGLPDLSHDTFQNMLLSPIGVVAVVLSAPVCEEFLFRGAIQRHLADRGWHPMWYILIVAALFSLIHMNPAQVPSAFLMGAFFGWLTYRSGNIALSLLLHMMNNLCGTILLVKGIDDEAIITENLDSVGIALVASVLVSIGVLLLVLLGQEFNRIEIKEESVL